MATTTEMTTTPEQPAGDAGVATGQQPPTTEAAKPQEGQAPSNGEAAESKDTLLGGKEKPESADGEGGDEPKGQESQVPEQYEFEGEVDAAFVDAATPVFKEIGLSQEQATGLRKLFDDKLVPAIQAAQREAFLAQSEKWAQELTSDPALGGEESIRKNVAIFKQEFGSPELDELLNSEDHPLGNHPALVRMAVKVARRLGEDKTAAETSPGGGQRSMDDRLRDQYKNSPELFK